MGTIIKVAVVLLSLSFANAATWYVRPLVSTTWDGDGKPIPTAGVYGSQNGTSYANAWNGLNSVVWGASGVNTGDELYICGSHVAAWTPAVSPNVNSFQVFIGQAGVTLRGDYPGDSGRLFGGSIDGKNTYNWEQDGNGVYRCAAKGGTEATWAVIYQIVDGIPQRLLESGSTTWTGQNGYAHWDQATNYLKTISGAAPSDTTLAIAGLGWRLSITNGMSNLVFNALQFYGGGLSISIPDSYVGATNITFTNCVLTHGWSDLGVSYIHVEAGHDYWNILNCEIGYTGEGIKSDMHTGRNARGSVGWLVSGNYFHDINTSAEYPSITDPHAIGLQGCSSWTIVSNRIERSGAAIEFWTNTQAQSNNIVAYNYIKDVYAFTLSGSGIIFTPSAAVNANGDGNKVYGNVIMNTGLDPETFTVGYTGCGIDLPPNYYVEVYNNTIYNAIIGINVRTSGGLAHGKFVNNLIYQARTNFFNFSITPDTDFQCDYNLCFSSPSLDVPYRNDPGGLNAHTVTSDPLLTGGTGANYFRLQSASPARGAGVAVDGYTLDRVGHTVANPPSIGAFEYFGNTGVSATLRAVNLIGR